METINLKPIGIIHTEFSRKINMPIQPRFSESKGYIELDNQFVDGLKDLDNFSHIILIYYFHESEGFNLTVKPFLDDKPKGVFATRAPKRPNPIGMSIVKLDSIKDNIIHISNVDIIDKTPLLDIKPYVPDFDKINASSGWVKDKIKKNHLSDTRFD